MEGKRKVQGGMKGGDGELNDETKEEIEKNDEK